MCDLCDYMQQSFVDTIKKSFAIPHYLHNVLFYQLRQKLHLHLRALKMWFGLYRRWKSKSIIFVMKTYLSSILYHILANANRHPFILILILSKLFLVLFFCFLKANIFSEIKPKMCLNSIITNLLKAFVNVCYKISQKSKTHFWVEELK